MAYVSYQFRIVAIIRGHLEAIEIKMNTLLRQDIHSCNSALVEMYMARNNLINQWMMFPICTLFFVMAIFCFLITFKIMWTSWVSILLFLIYWIIVTIAAYIIFIPFLHNERIRHQTKTQKKFGINSGK